MLFEGLNEEWAGDDAGVALLEVREVQVREFGAERGSEYQSPRQVVAYDDDLDDDESYFLETDNEEDDESDGAEEETDDDFEDEVEEEGTEDDDDDL